MSAPTILCLATPDTVTVVNETVKPEVNAILTGTDDSDLQAKVTSATLYFFAEEPSTPNVPETVENLVVYQSPTVRSSFTLPAGLHCLRHLSLNGFHFLDSTKLTFPLKMFLQTLKLTNCSSFRLQDLNIMDLTLQDCEKVVLRSFPKVALTVQRVKFCLFAGDKIPSSLEELRLEDTRVNKLKIPDDLCVFTSKNVTCKELQFGTFVIKKQEVDLEGKSISWDKNTATKHLRLHLRTLDPD